MPYKKRYKSYCVVKNGERYFTKTLGEAIGKFFSYKAYKLECYPVPEGKVHTLGDVEILLQRGPGIEKIDKLGKL